MGKVEAQQEQRTACATWRRALLVAAGVTSLSLGGCGDEQPGNAQQQSISYVSRAPGSDVLPTHETSYMLLAVDGPTRLASLRALILQSGKRCQFVISGMLVGGLDGTDEWRVKCSDTGSWVLWLRPNGPPSIDHCSAAKCG